MDKIKSLWCYFFGCDYVFNFKSIPSKGICVVCKGKIEFDAKTLEWNKVEKFKDMSRTDDQLIKRWVK